MRWVKVLAIIIGVALVLVLGRLGLSLAQANVPVTDSAPEPEAVSSSSLAASQPMTVYVWLTPDFDEGTVWVDGMVLGFPDTTRSVPSSLLQSRDAISWTFVSRNVGPGRHFFGRWAGSQVIEASSPEGAYELVLPMPSLRPEDELHMRLVSGIVLTETLLPQSSQQTPTTPPFIYRRAVYGDHSYIRLWRFVRPVTLTVPFYPIEKDIDLTLTPLLVETVLTQTASATGGEVGRRFSNQLYVQAGLLGRGEVRLRVRTIPGDDWRSAIALASAFRAHHQERAQEGATYQWYGELARLLERTVDFPAEFGFPVDAEEIDKHKETLVQVVTGEMSHTVQSDGSGLVIEAPFQLQGWRRKDRRDDGVLAGSQVYNDASSVYEEGELRLSLGRIVLGPGDVLTVSVENAAWRLLSPLPDELVDRWREGDSGPERDGFTAVYRGPKSFLLSIRCVPHTNLFVRQSVAMVRGLSRTLERKLSDTVKELWNGLWYGVMGLLKKFGLPLGRSVGFFVVILATAAPFVVLWIAYQCTALGQRLPGLLGRLQHSVFGERGGKKKWHRCVHVLCRVLLMLLYVVVLIAFVNSLGWSRILERLGLETGKWEDMPRPFAVPLVGGAWFLLLRLDTVLSRRGWRLWAVFFTGLGVEVWLNLLYSEPALNAIKYSGASGILSGAPSLALLPCLALVYWGAGSALGRGIRLVHEDLHALAFAALAAATFEVIDASLFAVMVLWGSWVAFSGLFLDRMIGRGASDTEVTPQPELSSGRQEPDRDSDTPGRASVPAPTTLQRIKEELQQIKGLLAVVDAMVATLRLMERMLRSQKADAIVSPPLTPHTVEDRTEDTAKDGGSLMSAALTQESSSTAAANRSAGTSQDTGSPEGLDDKLRKVREPLFMGVLLIAAIALAQDPLLRTRMASFARSVLIQRAWFIWILDPLARLATTLIPCLAMVLLVVLLDVCLERLGKLGNIETAISENSFLKVGLAIPLFVVFMLGVGGLDLFAGVLDLKLTDRIIYYVTVPLLTSIYLDWKPEKGKNMVEELKNTLVENLIATQKWIRTALVLLSLLAPRLASFASAEPVGGIIKALQTLQF